MTIQLRTGISDKYVIDRKENLNDQERLIPGKHFCKKANSNGSFFEHKTFTQSQNNS